MTAVNQNGSSHQVVLIIAKEKKYELYWNNKMLSRKTLDHELKVYLKTCDLPLKCAEF